MLHVAALVAATFALSTLPGVEEAKPSPADEAFRWTTASAPGSEVETRNATADAPPSVFLRRGRIAVAADGGDRDQQVLIEAGPVAITVTSGQVLVDHIDGTCFVVVVVGSALVRGVHSQHRGILLQSRQGVASAVDGALADVLTFERVPRLNDPEPLALQASAAPQAHAHNEPWPEEVPLLAAQLPVTAEPAQAAESAAVTPETDHAEVLTPHDDMATASPAAETAETPAAIMVPDADREMPEKTDVSSPAVATGPSLAPAWQRRGRR